MRPASHKRTHACLGRTGVPRRRCRCPVGGDQHVQGGPRLAGYLSCHLGCLGDADVVEPGEVVENVLLGVQDLWVLGTADTGDEVA